MTSPFTFSTTKPASSDALNAFPAFVQGQWAAIQQALGTLLPFGAPTTGWRDTQDDNKHYLSANAVLSGHAGTWSRDDTSVPSWLWTYDLTTTSATLSYASAGTGTITWTPILTIQGSSGIAAAENAIAVGANPAQTGAVRLTINQGIFSRNVPNNGDVQLMMLDLSGDLRLGDSTVNAIRPTADLTSQLGYANVRFTNLYTASLFSVNAANLANYLQVQGAATGAPPSIAAVGSDANIGMNVLAKGSATISFGPAAGGSWLTATGPASPVNYLQANAQPTGVAPGLSAVGSDTNIGINLVTKGTGQVQANGNPVVPTLVLKKGSGNGTHYTTTSTSYVDIDSTNLAYTVTVPVGQKVLINATLTYWVAGTSSPTFALTDGTTLLTEVLGEQQGEVNLLVSSTALTYIFVGDGASHTFKLRFAVGSSSNTLYVDNLTTVQTPMMTFWMGAAN
jgi:hypothetical protein